MGWIYVDGRGWIDEELLTTDYRIYGLERKSYLTADERR